MLKTTIQIIIILFALVSAARAQDTTKAKAASNLTCSVCDISYCGYTEGANLLDVNDSCILESSLKGKPSEKLLVVSFQLVYMKKNGSVMLFSVVGNRIPDRILQQLPPRKSGDAIFFSEVKVQTGKQLRTVKESFTIQIP